MTNDDFWASINKIVSDGYTPEGLQTLNKYAEQFISGRLVYERFSPSEQHGCSTGGANNVIASLLAAAEIRPDSSNAPVGSFKREQQCAAQQEDRIENWARKSESGNVLVIDCDIRINTASLKCNGKRILTKKIHFL